MRTVTVSRCLDKRLSMFGFEVADLFIILFTLSLLNVLFGASSLKPITVWVPTAAMAILLRYGKRGRPENFLLHWFRFQMMPAVFSAWESPAPRAMKVSVTK